MWTVLLWPGASESAVSVSSVYCIVAGAQGKEMAGFGALRRVGPSGAVDYCEVLQAAPDKRTITQPQYCIDINTEIYLSNSKNLPKNTRSKNPFLENRTTQ
jgi:hypothetical protein